MKIQTNLNASSIRPGIDHDINFEVLHGRIQIFFHDRTQTMDFIDEKEIAGFKVS